MWSKFSKILTKFAKLCKNQRNFQRFLTKNLRLENGAKDAPAEEPLRSAVLARALRDIAVITQHDLAALLLAAEPRPAAV